MPLCSSPRSCRACFSETFGSYTHTWHTRACTHTYTRAHGRGKPTHTPTQPHARAPPSMGRVHRGARRSRVLGTLVPSHEDARAHLCVLLEQDLADLDGGRLARVPGVLLEREAKHGDPLAVDSVEHRLDNPLRKPVLLPVVHHDHLPSRPRAQQSHDRWCTALQHATSVRRAHCIGQVRACGCHAPTYLVPVLGHLRQARRVAEIHLRAETCQQSAT
jgi:hypothetical protein